MVGRYIIATKTTRKLLEIGDHYCGSCNYVGLEELGCPFCGEIYPTKVETERDLERAARYIDSYIKEVQLCSNLNQRK